MSRIWWQIWRNSWKFAHTKNVTRIDWQNLVDDNPEAVPMMKWLHERNIKPAVEANIFSETFEQKYYLVAELDERDFVEYILKFGKRIQ